MKQIFQEFSPGIYRSVAPLAVNDPNVETVYQIFINGEVKSECKSTTVDSTAILLPIILMENIHVFLYKMLDAIKHPFRRDSRPEFMNVVPHGVQSRIN